MAMTPEEFEKRKSRIIKIIEIFFPQATIYLFGSRARGDFTPESDIDIAIDAGAKMALADRAKIVGMIDMLNMAQNVDVVDFHMIPATMKDNILKDGVIWKNGDLHNMKTLNDQEELIHGT